MKLMIFTMHSTTPWWRYLASRLTFVDSTVIVSDLRGDGDVSVVNDFYRALSGTDSRATAIETFGETQCDEIILRCRTLRSMERETCLRMIGAMTTAFREVFERHRPDFILSFTIDRYVMDVMERIGRTEYGIPFLEMTASIPSYTIIFMQRGRLVPLRDPPDTDTEAFMAELDKTDFVPTYVGKRDFNWWRYWWIFAYFELRGALFNVVRFVRRDPLNLHYLDARKNLKHKIRFSDHRALSLLDDDWERTLDGVPEAKRVFLGLQLFPEASLDYWLEQIELLDYDEVVLRIADSLTRAGYHIFVKDHPLQFGFRQRDLFERLARYRAVTLLPYEVSAVHMIGRCAIAVTMTGSIGYQAAFAGRIAAVCDPVYGPEEHFLHIRSLDDVDCLPEKIATFRPPANRTTARRDMARFLLRHSVPGDLFTFRRFDARDESKVTRMSSLIESVNAYLPPLLRERFGLKVR